MNCRETRELLVGYRENELVAAQRLGVEEHLRLCQACWKELQGIDEILSAVAKLPAPDPWPGFVRRLNARLERDRARGFKKWLQPLQPRFLLMGGVAGVLAISATLHFFFPATSPFVTSRWIERGTVALDPADSTPEDQDARDLAWLRARQEPGGEPLDTWPDRQLALFAFDKWEIVPEEVLASWKAEVLGVRGLEQMAGNPDYSERQVATLLDRISR